MRIAYLTGEYPRATDTFVQREIQAHEAAGLHVTRVAIRRPGSGHQVGPEQKAEAERTFYVLPRSPFEVLSAHVQMLFQRPRRYFQALVSAFKHGAPGVKAWGLQLCYFGEAPVIARHLLREGVEHLHNHFANSSCSVSMLVSQMTGIPFSFTLHGPAIFFEPRRWALGEKIARADFVACISHFCRSQGMMFATPEHWQKMRIVHCGVCPDRYRIREHRGQGSQLVFVGRLAAVKGLPVLLEAMALMPASVKLSVVGDGPDRATLEAMAKSLGLGERVDFLGYRSQDEVADLLAESDVFVMASFAEGVPVVLMEAMASGLPVVATQIAGVSELVEDGCNGYLVPPGDVVSLKQRCSQLLLDAALRGRMGRKGRAKVSDEFDQAKESHWLSLIMQRRAGESLRPSQAIESNNATRSNMQQARQSAADPESQGTA